MYKSKLKTIQKINSLKTIKKWYVEIAFITFNNTVNQTYDQMGASNVIGVHVKNNIDVHVYRFRLLIQKYNNT